MRKRFSGRRPSAAFVMAFAALILADAASRAVKRALVADKAKDSNKLNGIKSSKTPVPNHIPVLDAHGKRPSGALPAAAPEVTTEFNSSNRDAAPIAIASGASGVVVGDFGEAPIKMDGDGTLYANAQSQITADSRVTVRCHLEAAPTAGPSDTPPSGPFERFGQDGVATSLGSTLPQSAPITGEKVVSSGYYIVRAGCSNSGPGAATVASGDLNAIGIPK